MTTNSLVCVADFSSIVFCDDDWTPNHVEHVQRRKWIREIKSVEDDPKIKGYLRIKTDRDFMLIVAGDWGFN